MPLGEGTPICKLHGPSRKPRMANSWLQPVSFMQPCTIQDTPVGSYVYNIYAGARTTVTENFYERYQVYLNPHEVNPQAPTQYLAIKIFDVENQTQDDQVCVWDFINLLMEQCLPETRLRAAGWTSWEIVTNFVEWNDQLDTYLPLYCWTTGK